MAKAQNAAVAAPALSEVSAQPVTPAVTVALPETVTLAAPHGFLDEAGDLQAWLQGEVVTTKKDIALLFARGARLVGFGEDK